MMAVNSRSGAGSSLFEEEESKGPQAMTRFTSEVVESSLLSDLDDVAFLQEQGFSGRQARLELLMRGTIDGFGAREFHSRCDGKGPTLTVIKSEKGKVFGGYAGLSWGIAPRRVPYNDPEAWLFSLTYRTIHRQTRNLKGAVNHSQNTLVSFGSGEHDHSDLVLFNDCNKNSESSSNLGSTYQLPPGATYGSTSAKEYFAGSHEFRVVEIEVFKVTFV